MSARHKSHGRSWLRFALVVVVGCFAVAAIEIMLDVVGRGHEVVIVSVIAGLAGLTVFGLLWGLTQ